MKINEHEAVVTPRILLVPYCSHHVPTYHGWMQDEDIQKATASEPLTLPEEHAMQQSWRLDHDKLTFIVCYLPLAPDLPKTQQLDSIDHQITAEKEDAPSNMIGDVNLFLYEDKDEVEEDQTAIGQQKGSKPIIGELEIMIARKDARGKGLARETLLGFMWYIAVSLSAILEEYRLGSDERSERYLKYLRVKIDQHNVPSLALFENLGFMRVSEEPNYFGEVEMRTQVVDGRLVDVAGKNGSKGLARRVVYGV